MLPTFLRRLPSIACVLAASLTSAGCGDQPAAPPSGPAPGAQAVTLRVGDPLAEADAFIASQKIDRNDPTWRTHLPRPPIFGWPQGKKVAWVIDTNKGRMVAELWPQAAPHHASNVVYLSRLGFYDSLIFHRVIQGFMAQGGCSIRNGGGSTGYSLPLEAKTSVPHDRRGILSAARTGQPNSANSQFFITFAPATGLNPVPGRPGGEGYTVFGALIEGADSTLAAIEALGMPGDPGTPREPIVIEKTYVEVR